MLCTVKVEQLGPQNVYLELNLTTLFSVVFLNFFDKTTLIAQAGASISGTASVLLSKRVWDHRHTQSN